MRNLFLSIGFLAPVILAAAGTALAHPAHGKVVPFFDEYEIAHGLSGYNVQSDRPYLVVVEKGGVCSVWTGFYRGESRTLAVDEKPEAFLIDKDEGPVVLDGNGQFIAFEGRWRFTLIEKSEDREKINTRERTHLPLVEFFGCYIAWEEVLLGE